MPRETITAQSLRPDLSFHRRGGHYQEGDMDLTALSRTVVVDRLIALETEAQHLTVLAAVADACAFIARERPTPRNARSPRSRYSSPYLTTAPPSICAHRCLMPMIRRSV